MKGKKHVLLLLGSVVLGIHLLCTPVYTKNTKETKGTEDRRDPEPIYNREALENIFSGAEKLHYSISWSGGVKIGDLYLEIIPEEQAQNGEKAYLIQAKVTDYGLFHLFYPVNDSFLVKVLGPLMLPFAYKVHQEEGFFSKDVHRRSVYDQKTFQIRYRKNQQPEKKYQVDGPVYNEFSAFYFSRALDFSTTSEQLVPVFAEEKRHTVPVHLLKREQHASLLYDKSKEKAPKKGKKRRASLKISPRLPFKGLYEKTGDTVFWVSDDLCRIPLEIRSKLTIGSLTAELVQYVSTSSACARYTIIQPEP